MADDTQPETPPAAPALNVPVAGIAHHESGGNVYAENPHYPVAQGGPLGPHQFLASTWNDFRKAHPEYFQGMTDDQAMRARIVPQLSNLATQWLAGENAKVLTKAGFEATPANLAIAHALGGYGAVTMLKAGDNAKMSDVFHQTQPQMADTILKMNPGYQNMTVAQLKSKYGNIGGDTDSVTAAAPATTDTTSSTPSTPGVRPLGDFLKQRDDRQALALSLLSGIRHPQQQPVSQYASSTMPWVQSVLPAQQNSTTDTLLQLAARRGNNSLLS